MIVEILGEKIALLKDKALFWPAQRVLALSDVHLGKAESLQRDGIPMPTELTDLQTISNLIHQWEPQEILILGDFIHHPKSWGRNLIEELYGFLDVHASRKFLLIPGNHERGSLKILQNIPLELCGSEIV